MRKYNDIYISYLKCECCNSIFPIPRKKHAKREQGHIKDIWCYKCGKVSKFRENEKDGT